MINKKSLTDTEKANKIYHDIIAKDYEKDITTKELFNLSGVCRKRVDLLLSIISNKKGLCLDLGCGTGWIGELSKKYFKLTAGLDISYGMLKEAKKKNLKLVQANINRMPFKDNTFDAVVAFSVMHHLENLKDTVHNIYHILKKGGWFYSDWDFNMLYYKTFPLWLWLKRLVKSSKVLFYIVVCILAFFNFRKASVVRYRQYHNFMLAEYHANKNSGLDPEYLEKLLTDAGFNKVLIFFHNNTVKFDNPEPLLIDRLLHFNFKNLKPSECCRYIMILAQK